MAKPFTVCMIVKNEDQWIWYAISSIIKQASIIYLYDTGSRDKTVEIIKTFASNKIVFEEKGEVTPKKLVYLRNEQLARTKTDWFLLVDGDEVWPRETIEQFSKIITKVNNNKWGIVVKNRVCLGDIFHYQEERAGKYNIAGKKGHLNIRGYKKSSQYKWSGIYPNEAYMDDHKIALQEKKEQLVFLDDYIWHLTHLKRSSRYFNKKRKLEIGNKINKKELPEVFFLPTPSLVPSPWVKFSPLEKIASVVFTPLRKIKRRFN